MFANPLVNYTITCKHTEAETKFYFPLIISECISSKQPFSLQFLFDNTFDYILTFTIKTATHALLFQDSIDVSSHSKYSYSFCEPVDVYIFSYTIASIHEAVPVEENITIGQFQFLSLRTYPIFAHSISTSDPSQYSIDSRMIIYPKHGIFTYYLSFDQISSLWKETNFNDDTWNIGSTSNLPPITKPYQYYRSTFILPDFFTTSSGIRLTISFNYQVTAYMNGNLVYQHTPSYVNTIFPFSSHSTVLSFLDKTLVEGENVLAIVLYMSNFTRVKNEFDFSIALLEDDQYQIYDFTATSIPPFSASHPVDNAFDYDLTTYVLSESTCVGTKIFLKYNNNNRVRINQYSITNSVSNNSGAPSGWILYGSNDDEQWTELAYVHDNVFSGYMETVVYDVFTREAYNSYNMVITECSNHDLESTTTNTSPSLQLSEITFSLTLTPYSCDAQDGYWPSYNGTYAYKDCSDEEYGYYRSLCIDGQLVNEEDKCVPRPPSTFNYEPNVFPFYVNNMNSIEPNLVGKNITITIRPQLPDGLSLNPSDGTIYGVPVSSSPNITYILVASNESGSLMTTITLWIIDDYCPSQSNFPSIHKGAIYNATCEDPINYYGYRLALCSSELTWSIIDDRCLLFPAYINYPQSAYTFYLKVPIKTVIPLVIGGCLHNITVTPDLTNGLALDPETGEISGTPLESSTNQEYFITAANDQSTYTTTLTLDIIPYACNKTDIFPYGFLNDRITVNCLTSTSGYIQATCCVGNPPYWNVTLNMCVDPSQFIRYGQESYVFFKNEEITPLVPTVSSKLFKDFSIDKPLPLGLNFDARTAIISGHANDYFPLTSYTVTGVLYLTNITTTLSISIEIIYCQREDVWPKTESNTMAFANCTTAKHGVQARRCIHVGSNKPYWDPDPDILDCHNRDLKDVPSYGYTYVYIPVILYNLTYEEYSVLSTQFYLKRTLNKYTKKEGSSHSSSRAFGHLTDQNLVEFIPSSGINGTMPFIKVLYSIYDVTDSIFPEVDLFCSFVRSTTNERLMMYLHSSESEALHHIVSTDVIMDEITYKQSMMSFSLLMVIVVLSALVFLSLLSYSVFLCVKRVHKIRPTPASAPSNKNLVDMKLIA